MGKGLITKEQLKLIMQNSNGLIEKLAEMHTEDIDYILSILNASADGRALTSLDGTAETYKKTMRQWFLEKGGTNADPKTITELTDEWYGLTRFEWDGWVTFYQPDISSTSDGTKGGDNESLVCVPSTEKDANQDDYAGNPLFACMDCNWEVDPDTLQPVITAIDGVAGNFVRDDPEIYVGVLQQTGYHYWFEDDTTYTHGYSATLKDYENIEPLPEAINIGGTMRNFVLHGKYQSRTVSGKMTCCSGQYITGFISHNSARTLAQANGAQYSGMTACDSSFLILMCMLKYGSLTMDDKLLGCCNMNYIYYARVSETNVKRVLIPTDSAANLEVGMRVLLGDYTSSASDRAYLYSISGQDGAVITAIEDVEVGGTTYSAVYVDTEDTFDSNANGSATAGTTYISSFHWDTGRTDQVLGNDGAPESESGTRYPAKIQGIEIMGGAYDTISDSILSLYLGDDGNYKYEAYIVNRSANQATSLTDDYEATGLTCDQQTGTSAAWNYIKKNGFAKGIFFPTLCGGSSTTFTRDGFYQSEGGTTGTRVWRARGTLSGSVGSAGLSCLHGTGALSSSHWLYAARLSPNGNRGEWAP